MNADDVPTTLIVTRQGAGRAGQVPLVSNGRITTTVVLTSQETQQLAGMLGADGEAVTAE
jgi:hypothetical protein